MTDTAPSLIWIWVISHYHTHKCSCCCMFLHKDVRLKYVIDHIDVDLMLLCSKISSNTTCVQITEAK